MIVALFLVVFLLITLLVWSVVVNLWMGVPYVATSASAMASMVRLAELKPGETVLDLGAGDGRLLRAAKRDCPRATAIGYECTPTVFLWGKLRSHFARIPIQFRFGDLFKQNLTEADVIFVYLSPQWMHSLIPKFQRELRPGTRIISNAFTLPGREPARSVVLQGKRRERTVRLYIW